MPGAMQLQSHAALAALLLTIHWPECACWAAKLLRALALLAAWCQEHDSADTASF